MSEFKSNTGWDKVVVLGWHKLTRLHLDTYN